MVINRTQMLLLIMLLVHSALSVCRKNHLVDSDYRQMYCDADVVFRGSPYMAKSSVGIDINGHEIQMSGHTFKIQQWFRGELQPDRPTDFSVSRTWRQDDPCSAPSFPDQAESFLVFASRAGSTSYSVETCRHSFPWECLPDSLKASLPVAC
ncbi:hypothetical protein PoB_003400800 [Plakobranchus ocellatus]|uniref:Uncharacterized protein n=1 Tax=Plakobranchus ocellatus TaxID=259542 RepID=A0AAV4AL32_9GAST|nr:hypothetical protein PoB_003400800 [Plakobranchus ocellatus]